MDVGMGEILGAVLGGVVCTVGTSIFWFIGKSEKTRVNGYVTNDLCKSLRNGMKQDLLDLKEENTEAHGQIHKRINTVLADTSWIKGKLENRA
jgi:hypothetical protein